MISSPDLFDQLDRQIIEILCQFPRVPSSQIARQLGINPRTIQKRINRLVELEAIKFTTIFEPEVFGYSTVVDVVLRVEHEFEDEVIHTLLNLQQVSYVSYGQGSKDIIIELRLEGNNQLHEFIRERIETLPGVNVKRLMYVPVIIKNIHDWRPKPEDFSPVLAEE